MRRCRRGPSHVVHYATGQPAVGTYGVGVLEPLGRVVYHPAKHLSKGKTPPPPSSPSSGWAGTSSTRSPGTKNDEVRALASQAVELAHRVKLSETPNRRDAGTVTHPVILVGKSCKRLEQEF